MNFKKILLDTKVIILIISLVLALYSIYPNPLASGVAIRSVAQNSSAFLAGIEPPSPQTNPMGREVITHINNVPIKNMDDFSTVIGEIPQNTTFTLRSNKADYTIKLDRELGLGVYDAPTNNIALGLELGGGTRVLLQPERELDSDEVEVLISNMRERLNVYGLSDLTIREAKDLPPPLGKGTQYILVEISGASKQEVQDLLSKQGKFEAKVSNSTVFRGGTDIKSVCRSPQCAGLDPQYGCGLLESNEWMCRFRFSIIISQEAAQKQADATRDLAVLNDESGQYLEEPIVLYLDDSEVDRLNIGVDLKGRAVTDIQISGSGIGPTEQGAQYDAMLNMKRLQTILMTGSLPVKLDIVKMDTISPQLGSEFIQNALLIAFTTILAVAIIVFIRYRQLKISIAIIITMISELVLLLGVAALFRSSIDLAAIAGIIIAIGTGVDHQIVITDELLRNRLQQEIYDWKERMKRAFFIIVGAFLTVVVAMFPLIFAGAGLLRGFAITTIVGMFLGVAITRPAYAQIVEKLLKN